MAELLRRVNIIIICVLLLLLAGINPVAAEATPGPAEATAEQSEAKPVLGVVLLLTDQMRAEHNTKPTEMFRAAVNAKTAQKKTAFTVQTIPEAELISFLRKKDILPDSVGLMREMKLAQLLEFGKSKNVDFLLVVVGDAKVSHHMKTNINTWKDKKGNTHTNTYETDEVDYADVKLRAAYVDVKKGEYIKNYYVERRSGSPAVFGNSVRSVVNDGSKRVLNEFTRKFTL